MQPPEFVYLDLGNVLFTFSGGLEKLAAQYEKPYSEFERVFLQHDDEMCRADLTPQDLWSIYQFELGLEGEKLDFADFWSDHFSPIKESVELLGKLEQAEISVGIISNIYVGIFELITQKNIFPRIKRQTKILSCEMGIVKPEEKIYRIAEEASMAEPESILFVDDKATFLAPAQARGWQTFQFNYTNPAESVTQIEELLYLA